MPAQNDKGKFATDFGGLSFGDADVAIGRSDMGEVEIDARGASAPLPLLRAHRALRSMQPGQPLKVITSYPHSMAEFQAMVRYLSGYELVSQEQVRDEYIHVLVRRR